MAAVSKFNSSGLAPKQTVSLWRAFIHVLTAAALSLPILCAAHGEARLFRPPGTTRYLPMVRELRALQNWDRTSGHSRIRIISIGQTVQGRQILMVTMADKGPCPAERLLCICRQHGHEPASTEAALALIRRLARAPLGSPEDDWLSRVSVSIIPMANPDGAELFLRHNAADVDLNRDWIARTQPETRALYRTVVKLHPNLITDQHELYPDDSRPDFTETAGPLSGAPDSVIESCMYYSGIVQVAMDRGSDPKFSHWLDDTHPPRLAHRYCAIVLAIPTILFETNRSEGSGRTIADRSEVHERFMVSCIRLLAGGGPEILAKAGYEIDPTGTPVPTNTRQSPTAPFHAPNGPPAAGEENP